MNRTQLEQLKVLSDTGLHYNFGNRSVKSGGGQCLYGFRGCAVGRLITSRKLRNKMDKCDSTAITDAEIWKLAPANVKRLGQKFLTDLQDLHDKELYWNDNGLSEYGEDRVKEIARKVIRGYKGKYE